MGVQYPIKEWIIDNLHENGFDKSDLYKRYFQFQEETGSEANLSTYKRKVRTIYRDLEENGELDDNADERYFDAKAKEQKSRDLSNELRKENRQTYRHTNVVEAKIERMEEVLQKWGHRLKPKIKKHKHSESKYGIMHWTDHHWNEFISESDTLDNQFDFEIGNKRFKKYISESISFFKWKGITDLYIFMTGDQINSNRRQSEQLRQITSLTDASFIASYIFYQAIIELSKHFNIHIAHVVGNESRITMDMESVEILSKENWDYQIYLNLKNMFMGSDEIDFIDSKNPIVNLVQFPNGFNAILVHGHNIKKRYDASVDQIIKNYAITRNIRVHAVFSGHLHTALVGDLYSRGGSLSGPNSWVENDLGFLGRPSQNCYTVNDDLSYNGYKIDLKDCDSYEGYDLPEDLISYEVPKHRSNVKIIAQYNV